jgi:hypothetical protein
MGREALETRAATVGGGGVPLPARATTAGDVCLQAYADPRSGVSVLAAEHRATVPSADRTGVGGTVTRSRRDPTRTVRPSLHGCSSWESLPLPTHRWCRESPSTTSSIAPWPFCMAVETAGCLACIFWPGPRGCWAIQTMASRGSMRRSPWPASWLIPLAWSRPLPLRACSISTVERRKPPKRTQRPPSLSRPSRGFRSGWRQE